MPARNILIFFRLPFPAPGRHTERPAAPQTRLSPAVFGGINLRGSIGGSAIRPVPLFPLPVLIGNDIVLQHRALLL